MKNKNHKNNDDNQKTNTSKTVGEEVSGTDEKINVNKSVFAVNREFQQQRQKELEEMEAEIRRKQEAAEKKKQEAYDRRIIEEKKELMRLKQGIIEESEIIHEEQDEAVKLTFGKKIINFFYLNKWWLTIAVIFLAIIGVLLYSLFSKEKGDITVMFIQDNVDVGEEPGLRDYITTFIDDYDGNGKKKTTLYYIPYSDNDYANYQKGASEKLDMQFRTGDAVIVFGDKHLEKFLDPMEESLTDLEALFPGNPHVKGCRFMLKGTKFAEKIGVPEEYITDDLFLCIRTPQELYNTSKSKMQKVYDRDIEVFKAIIEDLS